MECKCVYIVNPDVIYKGELIDTLWNVNEDTTHRTTACPAN